MDAPTIKAFSQVSPMIYGYNTPGVPDNDGWTKIGYTERQTVAQRIRQQTHTAGIQTQIALQGPARFEGESGECFTDHDFHKFLVTQMGVERRPGTEWFHVDGPLLRQYYEAFTKRDLAAQSSERAEYELRQEQREAVSRARDCFEGGGDEFLWNAKPRFGKTLAAYDLVQRMGFGRVLIVTNRPSIADSWADDFFKYVGWRGEYAFVSDNEAALGKPGVLSRAGYLSLMRRAGSAPEGVIAFESLQGLKGSVYFGGRHDKLRWMSELEFDLLIVDEAHEGVDTMRTERAFRKVRRKHTLYLSGTPFRQLASDQFSEEQIFNWSYADEQEAREHWRGDGFNPYEPLPRLSMFTYQLSNMIREKVEKGMELPEEGGSVDYAFDLNEFFATNAQGKLAHEDEVRKFLRALATQEKYPFSTPALRRELAHTMWHLNRVASAKALARLLEEDEVFGEYKVVVAAGDGRGGDEERQAAKAIDQVREAIARCDRTITLTVGQLTVGVTIPEWSGVLMLCNMKSPSSYMQAAFRAQSPCALIRDGQLWRKENAYVFDFDPARTLVVFDEFASSLSADTAGGRGTEADREEKVRRLLNFFPVLGEDSEGRMVELDAAAVLSMPRRLKSEDVLRRGFMSNFLFQNIGGVFRAPSPVREILLKMEPALEKGRREKKGKPLKSMDDVAVDGHGDVRIPSETIVGTAQDLFGRPVYAAIDRIQAEVGPVPREGEPDAKDRYARDLVDAVKARARSHVRDNVIGPAADGCHMRKSERKRMEKRIDKEVGAAFETVYDDYEQKARIAGTVLEARLREAGSDQEREQAEAEHAAALEDALMSLVVGVQDAWQQTLEEKPLQVAERLERYKAGREKKAAEDEARARLRGFARTIPSFIMAYGDGSLTLANFDEYAEDDVFKEATGISLDDFRLLRDGGDCADPKTGGTTRYEGHVFDEGVFNDAVAAFWAKKQELADYFDESRDEDIFDYVPPQKTNQIFTPRWVVSRMVDQLEANDPGCFDDPDRTFADLYMKSGLFIAEIVKRLYRSEGLKAAFPDEKERIRHILEKQVYGMAPTRIIYLIAVSYILGFDDELRRSAHNFVQEDAAAAARAGRLAEAIEKHFG